MRVFLDANVLFTAAHNPRGKAALVIDLGRQGQWELFSSAYALEEARRNLAWKYPESLDALRELAQTVRLVRQAVGGASPPGLARKDWPIFQAAATCEATHLLTGDLKDFGPLMNRPEETSGIRIQTVSDFLAGLGTLHVRDAAFLNDPRLLT